MFLLSEVGNELEFSLSNSQRNHLQEMQHLWVRLPYPENSTANAELPFSHTLILPCSLGPVSGNEKLFFVGSEHRLKLYDSEVLFRIYSLNFVNIKNLSAPSYLKKIICVATIT